MTINRIYLSFGFSLSLLAIGCITTRVTPTSYTIEELLRRDAVSRVHEGMSAHKVAQTMQENGFACTQIKGGRFDNSSNGARSKKPQGFFDFVLCERADETSGIVEQVAVLLESDVATGEVLVKRNSVSAHE